MKRLFGGILPAFVVGLSLLSWAGPASAQFTSVYSKFDMDKDCAWQEDEGGGCGTCPGHAGNIIRICEGDLRQSAAYGPEGILETSWSSFGQFNWIASTVEWRLHNGAPVAAIHRQFVENMNDDGEVEEKLRGQVLVISTVARAGEPSSCPVGYVDARANADANVLARQVAEQVAPTFRCGEDQPGFFGKRGPYAGNPTGVAD